MSVTRYEFEVYHCNGGEMLVSETGDYVSYEDYAALEQKLAESQREFRAADATIENMQMQVEKLAAENAVLLAIMNEQAGCFGAALAEGFHDAVMESGSDQLIDIYQRRLQQAIQCIPPTTSTDAFLAEVRAQARNEGINYAASRLAAAFNHGFVDKPLSEVYDVVRMILDTKEELANSTLPAADGLSGEYAEKFLAESAAQLRKGVQS